MKKYLLILILLTFWLEGQTFNSIEFRGDVDGIIGEFDRTTLLKICHIEYPPLYKVWKKDPVFKSQEIKGFVDNITAYTHSMGYYRSKVEATTTDNSIVITIQKNEPIKVALINMSEEFKPFALFKQGKRFKTTDFTQTKKKIVRYLEEHGYPTYTLKAKALVDVDDYRVDINMSIDKGVKRYFAQTDINNSSKINNELIAEKIVYKEGELYDVLKLETSYENIYQLGVFDQIKMEADFNHTDGKSPINLTLEEGKTKEFASSLGYDTQDGMRGGVEYIDHNFFGNLREFRAGATIAKRGYTIPIVIYDPYVQTPLLGKINVKNELGYSRWDYDSYVENLFTERVTVGKSFIGLDHFFGFQMEHSEIKSGIPVFLSGNYLINSLFYRVVIDKRDSQMDAKNGYYTSLYAEKSMKQIGSELDYVKLLAEARYIKEFAPMVFAFKVTAGSISEATPPFKHFYLGGAMSNRGYEYRDLGVHSAGYPIGGLSVIDGSFESRYYVMDDLSVVGFLDASKISQEVNDFTGKWYPSYGIGLRYLSVIGPLRVDVGYPQEGGFALHLGIGQVF